MTKVEKRGHKSGRAPIIIEGCYVKNENLWTSTRSASNLLVVHRQTTTQAKSSEYVLHIDSEGNRTYISSLYGTKTPDTYRIDYKGVKYDLIKSGSNSLCISIGIILT